jgi:Mg-chelatase subunit ChlD
VPIARLPDVASSITAALDANAPGGTTPTEPALAGAIEYAKAFTDATPEQTAVVVFVTDGMPNGCNSTVAGAAAIAQAGYSAAPSIKTYVVGLGATAALDEIALAGSGGVDHYFPASGDVSAQLLAALETISRANIR